MAKNKIGLEFSGWEDFIADLDRLGGDIEKTVDGALVESQKIIADAAHESMKKHHRLGYAEDSITEDKAVMWNGKTAEVNVGFDLSNGGMPSIFLMYGTPRMDKDVAVYNAVYGTKIKKQVAEMQKKAFLEAVAERMG